MFAPFTLIALIGTLLATTLAAPAPPIDVGKVVNGTFVPSKKTLDQHRAYYKDLYVKDPATNKTIPNPAYKTPHLSKRVSVDLPRGSVCKIDAAHSIVNSLSCTGGSCTDQSYEVSDSRLYNNDNGNTLGFLGNINGEWVDSTFYVDGYRTVYMSTGYTVYQTFGWDYAYMHLYGLATHNMMGDYWCWYDHGVAGWGTWGTAACLIYCNDFLWVA